ncbi:MAG: hypothetical protein IJ740_18885 [Ruminococcus sp.]|nr:hypothetical protein [Ruminococcus sp.]MBR1752908.1 hypothetical protein [Ruminococcus sp.]
MLLSGEVIARVLDSLEAALDIVETEGKTTIRINNSADNKDTKTYLACIA